MTDVKNIVEAEHICKSYVGVQALDDVSITIKEGEIKCLAGENGCGKSTFVKIIAGVDPSPTDSLSPSAVPLHWMQSFCLWMSPPRHLPRTR